MTSTPSSKPATDVEIVRTLLASVVDYAGLFPPAELDLEAAAAAFDRHRRGEDAWMLGSFVVPLGRVDELADAARALAAGPPDASRSRWPVSALVRSFDDGARLAEGFGKRFGDVLTLGAIEVGPPDVAELRTAGWGAAPAGVGVFYEVPLDDEMEDRLDQVAAAGARAKVRTGGVTAEAFPSTAALARFLHACAARDVPFKATAGLHHACRGRYPLTYEPDSARATMHGFLALALVAGLVREQGVDEREAAALLTGGAEDLDPGDDTVGWCGRSLTAGEVRRTRETFFCSFGSCSFDEPLTELVAVGLLGGGR